MKKKLLIIGSRGLLGTELVSQAKLDATIQIYTSDKSDEGGIDITKPDSIDIFMKTISPDFVINVAAFTNVDACETEDGFKIAKAVNSDGPLNLLKSCKKYKAGLIHISSDYVFGDNKQEGYTEDYTHFKPLNKYAETKYLAEQNIIEEMGGLESSNFKDQSIRVYIVRTSWLFGVGAQNFIAKILQYAKEREFLEVVTDEVSSPTYVKDLSQGLLYLIKNQPTSGIYHISGFGHASRYDFAKEILQHAKINTEVRPTTMDKFERKTKIANYSYLLNTKLPQFRTWQEMVEDYVINQL